MRLPSTRTTRASRAMAGNRRVSPAARGHRARAKVSAHARATTYARRTISGFRKWWTTAAPPNSDPSVRLERSTNWTLLPGMRGDLELRRRVRVRVRRVGSCSLTCRCRGPRCERCIIHSYPEASRASRSVPLHTESRCSTSTLKLRRPACHAPHLSGAA